MGDWDEDTKFVPEDHEPKEVHRDRAYLIVLAGANVGEMFKISKDEVVIGRGQNADVRIFDEGISRAHCTIKTEQGGLVIEDHQSRNGTFANGAKITRHKLSDGDKIQVGSTTILKFTYHDDWDEDFQRHMYESALLDALTKTFNKRYFLDRLESEFRFAKRHKVPLSLVLFDIDHFKKVNDTYGHLAGDYVLSSVACVVQEQIRTEDVLARYGGEEFAVICRAIDMAGGYKMAERVRRAVESQDFLFDEKVIKTSVSVGVAGIPEVDVNDPIALISAADVALYSAKRNGRNQSVVAGPAVPGPTK